MRSERRENVAQVDRVLGVSVEVGSSSQPWRRDAMDHGTIAQNGQVEGVAVEGDELRVQLRDLVAECGDQLLLGPLTYVGRTQRVHRPMIALAVSDQRADAHNGVVDVLRELVAEGFTNVRIPLADKIVGGREPGEVGHGLQVPDDDAWFHVDRNMTRRAPSRNSAMPHRLPVRSAPQLNPEGSRVWLTPASKSENVQSLRSPTADMPSHTSGATMSAIS